MHKILTSEVGGGANMISGWIRPPHDEFLVREDLWDSHPLEDRILIFFPASIGEEGGKDGGKDFINIISLLGIHL